MKRIRLYSVLLIALMFVFPNSRGSTSVQGTTSDYSNIIEGVNMIAVQRHVQFFSSLRTRGVGYSGSEAAAQYIFDAFRDYSLKNVSFQEFSMAEAVDHGASLTVLDTGQSIEIYPIRPNLVVPSTTPPQGITGRLIYVGDGYLSDFDGKEVEGSIVIMNWYGDENWLVAAKLDAKAVIFIPPEARAIFPTQIYSVEGGKSVEVPMQFPRFYAPDAESLLNHINETVNIRANTYWERVKGKNVLGFVEGENPNVIILISAYYDSGGIVPSYAPGAQEACGISALLELARYLNDNPPGCTLLFVAFSAHHQSWRGAIEFANDYMRGWDPSKVGLRDKIYIWFHLDFSTGSDTIYVTAHTPNYNNYGGYLFDGIWDVIPRYFAEVFEDINEQRPGGRTYEGVIVTTYGMRPTSDARYIRDTLDHSSYTNIVYESLLSLTLTAHSGAGGEVRSAVIGYAFATAYDPRPYYGRPFDTFDKVNFDNLQRELELTFCLLNTMLHLDDIEERFVDGTGLKAKIPAEAVDDYMKSIRGKVGYWNTTVNWYNPVPDAVVCMSRITGAPRFYMFTLTDENGTFDFSGFFSHYIESDYNHPIAYKINTTTGRVIYAPDQGLHAYPLKTWTRPETDYGWVAVFEAATVVLFDAVDPKLFSPPTETGRKIVYSVHDAETFVAVESWGNLGTTTGKSYAGGTGTQWTLHRFYSASVLAAPPNTPFIMLGRRFGSRNPFIILTNSSEEYPNGYGYMLKPGQQLHIPFTSLRYAENLYWASHEIYQALIGISSAEKESPQFLDYQEVKALVNDAQEALTDHKYSEAFLYSMRAWGLSSDVYMYVRPKTEDAASVVPFFAFTLIPFVFLVERILFSAAGLKRVIAFLALFMGTLGALYFLHPGFSLAASPIMLVISATIIILLMPMVMIMFGRVSALIRVLRIKILGRHAEEISRGSEIVHAFSTGVRNMRRRKLRSALTLISLILLIAGLISFTSITAMRGVTETSIEGFPLYNGIYIHRDRWGEGEPDLGQPLLDYLMTSFGDQAFIAPRAWKYTLYSASTLNLPTRGFRVTFDEKVVRVPILWGLTIQEKEVSSIEDFLVTGRWFEPLDKRPCILMETHAEDLDIDPEGLPVKVTIEGSQFTVVGILSDYYTLTKELDGEEITPIKLDVVEEENPWNEHVLWDYVLILKFEDVIRFGGVIASVSMTFEDADAIGSATEELVSLLNIPLWSCVGEETKLHSKGLQLALLGFEAQLPSLAIVALSIANLLITSIYERRREIFTYATVGLSPLDVAMIFFSETVVYALVGAVIGYLTGLFMCGYITAFMGLELTLNYSSSWVAIAVLFAMAITFTSSIIPLHLASRQVTPSLKRVWTISTKPKGKLWEIPLPFHITEEDELKGIICYLFEYLEAHGGEAAPDFIARNLHLKEGEVEGLHQRQIAMDARLPPYDLGVVQTVAIQATNYEEHWEFRVFLERSGGDVEDWVRLNQTFVDRLRKQLLLWRMLAQDEKSVYAQRFNEIEARLGR